MLQLNSKNYNHVDVYLVGEDSPLQINTQNGIRLMGYLTGVNKSTHIKITDTSGNEQIVRILDIKRVVPSVKVTGVEKYV